MSKLGATLLGIFIQTERIIVADTTLYNKWQDEQIARALGMGAFQME